MSTKAIWKSKSRLFYAQWNAVKHSTSLVCRNGLSMRYSLTCSIWPCFSCCHSHAYTERYKYHNTLALLYIYSYGLSSLFVMCSCVVPDQCVVTKYHKKKTCDILTDMLKQQTHLKMGLTQNDWNCPPKKSRFLISSDQCSCVLNRTNFTVQFKQISCLAITFTCRQFYLFKPTLQCSFNQSASSFNLCSAR